MKGATLIELLLVVAIIMLLVALLLPGFSRAKDQAQKVSCRVAVRSYAVRFSPNGRLVVEIPAEANCHDCHRPRYNATPYLNELKP